MHIEGIALGILVFALVASNGVWLYGFSKLQEQHREDRLATERDTAKERQKLLARIQRPDLPYLPDPVEAPTEVLEPDQYEQVGAVIHGEDNGDG